MKKQHIGIIILAVVALYLVSMGPGIFMAVKLDKSDLINNKAGRFFAAGVVIVYYPHFYIMAFSEYYFNYIGWWVKLGGEKMNKNHAEFRKHLLGYP